MLNPDKYKDPPLKDGEPSLPDEYEDKAWKSVLEMGLCMPAILVEYANYAIESTKRRVPDWMIDSLFDKLNTVLHKCATEDDGSPMTSQSKYCSYDPKVNPLLEPGYKPGPEALGLIYKDLCPVLSKAENASTRLDKVETIEAIMSAQHESGFLLEYGCDAHVLGEKKYDYQHYMSELTGIVLDMLFERT